MSLEKPATATVWGRKDLRLDDNAALHAAIEGGGPVIPVYMREPAQLSIGPLGAAGLVLHHSPTALKASLKSLGSDLIPHPHFRKGRRARRSRPQDRCKNGLRQPRL
ncbi:deoxyribodipyrimidine photo-lyase [Neorhizobium sp. T25_27]|uniref:deoxyribodipyrimidine photo-lyase n=1 Tax=Neorhizobium sp. T25_27 TaxID=2093831 RepID=UPI000CFA2C1F|nr:deoxyribodipyrimidine photo-lyase [Neorhizobium sp. T25_27]